MTVSFLLQLWAASVIIIITFPSAGQLNQDEQIGYWLFRILLFIRKSDFGPSGPLRQSSGGSNKGHLPQLTVID